MLVIYIERWTRKVFRNDQKEEKSEAEKNESEHCGEVRCAPV